MLAEQISYEKQALKDMKAGNANIPEGWGITEQKAFVAGMMHAFNIVKEALLERKN